jgi:hypothetical protein
MPLKYCQFASGTTSFSGRAYISGDGNTWIASDPSFGANGEGRIVINSSAVVNGSGSTLDVGKYYDAPYSFNEYGTGNFVYDIQTIPSNPANYSFQAKTRLQGTLLTTAQGSASWVPSIQISSDESTVAYKQTASSVVVKTWNGSSWVQKGSLISGSVIDISRNGNMVFVRDSTPQPAKIYIWNGSAWQLLQTFTSSTTFIYFAASVDRLISIETGLIKAYDLVSGALQQIGGDIPVTGAPNARMSPDGTKIGFEPNIVYSLSGNVWNQLSLEGSILANNYQNFSLSNTKVLAQYNGILHWFELKTVPQLVSGQFFSGKVGVAFTPVTPQIIDGPSIYWSSPDLPPGLVLDQSTGVISGTPTTKGVYTITIYPSAETTTDSWRWGIPSTLTLNIADRNRIFSGASAALSVYYGETPATSVYYGSKKLWPATV